MVGVGEGGDLERAVGAVPIDQTGSDIKRDGGTDQVR